MDKSPQRIAQDRIWKVMRLRGVYSTIVSMEVDETFKGAILVLVDQLLLELGVEKETKRRARLKKEIENA